MKNYLVLLTFLCAFNTFSQKEANLWYFGKNAGIDFNTNPPTALTNGQLNTTEGCSSFSDANGNLLFYSDGISVYGKDHKLMSYSNGVFANNLEGNPSSTQSGMIIPKPESTTIYYLFTVGTKYLLNNPGFNYYTIDMSKRGGLGEVTAGPINLAYNPIKTEDSSKEWSEKVAAVKGKECNEFWVISFVTDTFFAYKIDKTGVKVSDVVVSTVNFTASDKRGYLQVSPDGTKIALADFNASNTSINGSLKLFDFDNTTGIVANNSNTLISRFSNNAPYGVSFSRDSKKLYTSTFDGAFSIYQFDLDATNIASSKAKIITKNGYRGALQLGPDGKIYVSIPGKTSLDAIENPNAASNKIIYTNNAINLGGRVTTQGLPPFISSLLLPIEITDTDTNQVINDEDLQFCIGDNKTIKPETITGNNITYEWFFNDETTAFNTDKTKAELVLNSLTQANNGKYTLIVKLTDDCGSTTQYDGTFNIEVYEPASAKANPDPIIYCDSDNSTDNNFDLADLKNTEILNGLDPTNFIVLYFDSQTKAEANETGTDLPNPHKANTAGTQTIYARVHNKKAPNACFAITSFSLEIYNAPIPNQPEPYKVCDNNDDGDDTNGKVDTFLLSNIDDEIYGTLDKTQYNISYHTTATGANTNDAVTLIDKNTNYSVTNSKTVYIRIENKDNATCYDANLTLNLIVNTLPLINAGSFVLKQCDNDADLQTTFNLTEVETNISNDTDHTFKYFKNELNAKADTPEITDITSYFVNNTGEAWVRTTSTANGCYRISKIDLIVSYTPNQSFGDTIGECDDFLDIDGNDTANNSDSDGITNFDLSDIPSKISTDVNINIEFYESDDDRTKSLNEITETQSLSNYRNINLPYTIGNPVTIYYKLINKTNNDCQGIGEFYLKVNPIPSFSVEGEAPNDPILICSKNIPYSLEVFNPTDDYDYLWTEKNGIAITPNNTQNITIIEAGIYTVTAFSKDTKSCSRQKTIVVLKSNFETLDESFVTIMDGLNSSNTNLSIQIDIPIDPLINEEFQYALKDEEGILIRDFQDSAIFNDLEGGIYTILVENKNGCGSSELVVSVIQFPKFFTPNGDGKNDNWTIKGINNTIYSSGSISIFNRYGKIIAQVTTDNQGWDGTYNGKILPSDDYWFNVQLIPADTNKSPILKNGHFSLLRK